MPNDPFTHIDFSDLTDEQRQELLERLRASRNGGPAAERTEILFVLDRSGSMGSMAAEAIGGFNAFVEEQRRLPGEAALTLVLFDHEYDVVYQGRPLAEVPALDAATYVPRGTTALHDAVGRTIHDALARHGRLSNDQPRPRVVMAILTDGLENASRDYRGEQVRSLIEERRRDGWEFVFLAANQDAVTTAERMAIPRADAAVFDASPLGVGTAFADMSMRVAEKRRRV